MPRIGLRRLTRLPRANPPSTIRRRVAVPPIPTATALQAEGDRLQEELRQLEVEFGLTLLFNLGDAARECWQEILRQERFWNFVRFFGLGFALGILVKALTG